MSHCVVCYTQSEIAELTGTKVELPELVCDLELTPILIPNLSQLGVFFFFLLVSVWGFQVLLFVKEKQ